MSGNGLVSRIVKVLSSTTFISAVWLISRWPNPSRLPQRWMEAMQSRDSDAPARPVLVDIRFPEGSPARNQVLVERLVANGWVEPADSARSP